MNRLAAIALALAPLLAPAVASAAVTNQYNDPAMSFTAPPDFHALSVPPHDPATFDNPAVMAAYVKNPGRQNAVQITLRMDNFDGDAAAFATNQDNDLRSNTDGVFIKKTAAALPNGMPAYWEDVTIGTGFDQIKTYQYLWSDGVRGVVLSVTARDGMISENDAKQALSDVSAVAYPRNRY